MSNSTGDDLGPDQSQPVELSLDQIELGERVAQHLEGVGERREIRLGHFRVTGKRRRPSGERPPLPRQLRASGWFWLVIGVITVVLWISLFAWPQTADWWTQRDLELLNWFVDLRNDAATAVGKATHALGSVWAWRPLRWITVAILIAYRRWRHLLAAAVAIVGVESLLAWIVNEIARPRPFVEIIGAWSGYSHPAQPVASLSVTLALMGFSLFPKGRWRNWWMGASVAAVGVLILARGYLGVDHLTDGIVAALIGGSVAVVMFRLFVPEALFPVRYRRGVTAHLDVGGARGSAIRNAVADQLGWAVTDLEPVGLAGSGGSTPLRLWIGGGPAPAVFAKLYASSHLRADRWYKLGRTILYGALEDEVRFTSVRRLVEYEHYMLLTMREAGVPSAEPHGIVEITPEREYLVVTEFLQDAREITDAAIDDEIIDAALVAVRQLWDGGLAHRDIKPSNVMVREGRVRLIDVAFGTLRPTPWRQAVDLANMMLVLALHCEPERVYLRALRYFAPEDIAEAFAATRSITIPRQLQTELKARQHADNLDLVEAFRSLAPPRDPISVQRFSVRRLGLAAAVAGTGLVLVGLAVENITRGGLL